MRLITLLIRSRRCKSRLVSRNNSFFSSRRSRTYVFLRCEPTVFTLAIVAGSGDKNGGVLNFYVRLKKVNKRGKIINS